tara:strand:- start:330622 stop:331341 length:720 start_codon:yes stop_codon:yes gene_type:complete
VKLSAPIYVLKKKARELKRSEGISLNEALDVVAREEGFSSWSLLASKSEELLPREQGEILGFLNAGDLMLIGARPGHGKTTFALELLVQGMREKRQCFFFSLEYTFKDVLSKVADLDTSIGANNEYLHFDFSDEISASYIIEKVTPGAVVVVDYLQLLDQVRSKPSLQSQVSELEEFARESGCVLIFISQVDREADGKKPGLSDVRLPNALDLDVFNKALFIHEGKKYFVRPEVPGYLL